MIRVRSMGTFALCIENATRDIHTLLTLHRVHPQVHADIQRILGSLLRKQYTDMTVLHSPELADSPEQICRALVDHIVDQTLHSAIPAANTAALEQRCTRLEGEKDALEVEARKAENQLAEEQMVLRNLKDAHDYMLRSYFREVLTLRSRIDVLQRQNRAYRAQATAASAATATAAAAAATAASAASGVPAANTGASAALTTFMGSQLQQFVFSHDNSIAGCGNNNDDSNSPCKDSVVNRRLGADEVFTPEAAGTVNCDAKVDTTDTLSRDRSPTHELSETRRGVDDGESLGGRDRSVRITSPFTATSSPRGQRMAVQTTTTYELVPSGELESVDAIFDYEEYVRILNGERGSWSKRFVAVMNEPDGSARRRRRSLRMRTRSFSDVLPRSGDPLQDAEPSTSPLGPPRWEQQQQQTKMKGFQWLLHLALEPIRHKFHTELDQLRQDVHTMQEEHARDVRALSRALLQVQSSNDGLLDFLETFVEETRNTIAVLSRDSRAHTITDLLFSGALPAERLDKISTFFMPSAPPSLAFGSPSSPLTPPPPLTQLAEMMGTDSATGATAAAMAAKAQENVSPDSQSASSRTLHPQKEWRLKPAARLYAEKRTAAMKAADRRLKRPDLSKAAPVMTTPPEENTAVNYYRADLGLPYWSAHPITTHAQEVFGELQLAAKDMRVARVQQLYAYEEAVTAGAESGGGQRVRFNKPLQEGGTPAASAGAPRRRRRHNSASSSVKETADSFYAVDTGVADSTASAGPVKPRRRLQEGWRNKTVIEGDEATAGDLLQELVHLRMRRACDQIRLTRVQDIFLRTFYPDLVGPVEAPVMWTKRGRQVLRATEGAKLMPAELPPINFTSPEEVLKHRALQRVRNDTHQRIARTSQRIAELLRLLEMYFAENEVQEAVDHTGIDSAQRLASEEAAGLYRVNGQLKSKAQLWNSPYLNDGRGPGDGVLYLPIGLASTVDAAGNVGGGAGAVVMLGDTPISVAPFAAKSSVQQQQQQSGTVRRGKHARADRGMGLEGSAMADGEANEADSCSGNEADAPEDGAQGLYNAPYVAVTDYCRGVQLGRPVGCRGGPVYLFQDASTGAYYVGDAEGRPALRTGKEEGKSVAPGGGGESGAEDGAPIIATDNNASDVEERRPPLAMTRILFPAPLHQASFTESGATTTAAAACDENAKEAASRRAPPGMASVPATTTVCDAAKALQPLYLVPMAIPLSDEEAAVREGWQACHRHGHTRQDPIFYTTLSPLPLSSSYHHVVPQRQEGRGEVTGTTTGVGNEAGTTVLASNKYLTNPPRVFQPADEASSMVRVRALQLQSRSAPDMNRSCDGVLHPSSSSSSPPSGAVDAAACSVNRGALRGALASHHADDNNSRNSVGEGRNDHFSSVRSDSTNPGITASSADTAFTVPTTRTTPPTSVQPTLLSAGSAPLSPGPLDPIYPFPTQAAVAAATTTTSTVTPAAATATGSVEPQPSLSASMPLGLMKAHNDNAVFAATAPLPLRRSSPPSSPAPVPTAAASSVTAAVLFAKQQRTARLAKEAEAAQQLKTQRQEAWQQRQQRLGARAPSSKDAFFQLPHRLTPLPLHGAETALLPPAASSARLQRQMHPEKYALSPPPLSRRTDSSKQSSLDWNLKDDA